MARPPREYVRLPGRGGSLVGRSRLWLGSNHLLLVETQAFYERYARFYFTDIQAVLIRQTATGTVLTAVYLGLTVLGASIAVTAGRANPGVTGVFAGCAAVGVVALLINLIGGRTVETRIFTSVSEVRLRSLSRLKTVRKVMARLQPRLDEAQGVLGPEAEPAGAVASASPNPSARARVAAPAIPPLPATRTRWHGLAFGLLFLFGATLLADHRFPSIALVWTLIALAAAGTVPTIVALVQPGRLRPGVRALIWSEAGLWLLLGAAGYGRMIFAVVENGSETAFTVWQMIRAAARLSGSAYPALVVIDLASALVALGIAVTGLGLLLLPQPQPRLHPEILEPPAVPPPAAA